MLAAAAEPASSPTSWLSRSSFLEVNPKLVNEGLCFLLASLVRKTSTALQMGGMWRVSTSATALAKVALTRNNQVTKETPQQCVRTSE